MAGKIFCTGVGPGDPELMTIKALNVIKNVAYVAFPYSDKDSKESTAFNIAREAFPEIEAKEKLPIYSPMVRDEAERRRHHLEAAAKIEELLMQDKDIAYLTLGDPTVYCTFSTLADILKKDGFEVVYVSGVTSFCAVAARLGVSLADGDEALHIIPAAYELPELKDKENLIFMKAASRMGELKKALSNGNRQVYGITNCGMEDEKTYNSIDEIPDDAGYFTVIIAKS